MKNPIRQFLTLIIVLSVVWSWAAVEEALKLIGK